jgi:hypothetical protein
VIHRSLYFLVFFALAAVAARHGCAQDKNQDKTKDPKFVFDLEKPAPPNNSNGKDPAGTDGASHPAIPPPFGKACGSYGAARDGYRNFDSPVSISELFGAPIEVITIRRLGPGQEKLSREELRKHILTVLSAQTVEVSRYADWDEGVWSGIVATIQFYDHTKGILEESGGHVCFSDYAGTVWWLRIPTNTAK